MAGEQLITVLAAAIATGVSAQGMWVFMGNALHLAYVPRVAFFSFLEVMVVQSALRARAAQRHGASPGVDAMAMWALTCLSAMLSATEADNVGMLLLRLSAPLVAAWGWERSMALERRRRTGTRSRINWRITPERLLIRIGLADPDPDRTASDAAAQRSLVTVVLAADDARAIRNAPRASIRQIRRAHERLREAMRRAAADGGLVPFEGRDHREVLIDYIAVLRGGSSLLDLEVPSPFEVIVRGAAQRYVSDQPRSVDQFGACADDDRALAGECSAPADGETVSRQLRDTRPTGSDGDIWGDVAERVCEAHPVRRRQRAGVEAILRLHFVEHRTYPEIAPRSMVSASTPLGG